MHADGTGRHADRRTAPDQRRALGPALCEVLAGRIPHRDPALGRRGGTPRHLDHRPRGQGQPRHRRTARVLVLGRSSVVQRRDAARDRSPARHHRRIGPREAHRHRGCRDGRGAARDRSIPRVERGTHGMVARRLVCAAAAPRSRGRGIAAARPRRWSRATPSVGHGYDPELPAACALTTPRDAAGCRPAASIHPDPVTARQEPPGRARSRRCSPRRAARRARRGRRSRASPSPRSARR